jgi:hypothetical protein
MNAFPNDMPAVESVLTIFCDAFLFREKYRFHFRPTDVVSHIYKNTTGPYADELQLENLAMELENSFGVDLIEIYSLNTTLRDIVELVCRGEKEPN